MVDEASPPRRRGRPKKAPEDVTRRPNFSLRVRQEIYDDLTARAHASGRSISEEAESRLEYLFSDAPANALKAAIADAAKAARNEEFEEIQNDFGGLLSFTAARQWVDALNAEMRKASAGSENDLSFLLDEGKSAEFSAALASHIPALVGYLSGLAKFLKVMSKATQSDLDKAFERMRQDPELRRHFERMMSKSEK